MPFPSVILIKWSHIILMLLTNKENNPKIWYLWVRWILLVNYIKVMKWNNLLLQLYSFLSVCASIQVTRNGWELKRHIFWSDPSLWSNGLEQIPLWNLVSWKRKKKKKARNKRKKMAIHVLPLSLCVLNVRWDHVLREGL